MARDREQTRKNILQAVGKLLARSGFREAGINAIAREAGVDKKLIYRYFGGIHELFAEFAGQSDYWPGMAELAEQAGEGLAEMAPKDLAKRILLAFGRALRTRPLTQEIMRWELLERNEITDALASHREAQGNQLYGSLDALEGIDLRAIGSLLAAGQTYLILRSKTVDTYSGLQLNSDKDWARIEQAVCFLVDAAIQMGQARSSPEQPGEARSRALPAKAAKKKTAAGKQSDRKPARSASARKMKS